MIMNSQKKSYFCEICKVASDSDIVFATHLKGQKHLKKMNSPLEQNVTSNDFICSICNVSCTGEKNYESHLSGAKHQKTLNLQQRLSMKNEPNAGDEKTPAEETTGDMPDMPGITAVKSQRGKSVEYKCNFCDCILNSPVALNIHVEGKKHKHKANPQPQHTKSLNKEERQLFGTSLLTDDRYVIHRHTEIDASHQQINLVMKFIQSIETGLRRANAIIASENEKLENGDIQSNVDDVPENEVKVKLENIDSETRDPKRVSRAPISFVRRVGNLFKGLLLKDDLDSELVVICKSHPTRSILRNISEKLDSLLKEMKRDCIIEQLPNSITVSQTINTSAETNEPAAGDSPPSSQILRCKIYFALKKDKIPDSNGTADNEADDNLDMESCLRASMMLKRARWFEFNSSLRPCLVMQRIMRDIKRRNPVWQSLTDWALELFVHRCLTIECTLSSLTPSQALRRIFESVVECIGDELNDPCETTNSNVDPESQEPVKVNVLASLSDENRQSLIDAAQANLKLMESGETYKIFGYEKPLEESEFKTFPVKPSRFNQFRRKRLHPKMTNYNSAKKALVENTDASTEEPAA